MTTPHIAFLGTGSMNGSIAAGLIASGYPGEAIRATVRSEASMNSLREKLGHGAGDAVIIGCELKPEGNLEAVEGASVVLLGVKPYGIVELAREISPALAPDALVISVAAGVTLETLQASLPTNQPVIRCMPNTPSSVGRGVLAISVSESVTEQQLELAKKVLGAVGQVVVVREDQMDAVTAVSGSGPAYAFLLAETMAAAGVKLGLDEETARTLASATVAGAGALLDTNPDAAALRKAVTSPNGTTERAINTYIDKGLFQLTEDAMRACAERSAEMSRMYTAD